MNTATSARTNRHRNERKSRHNVIQLPKVNLRCQIHDNNKQANKHCTGSLGGNFVIEKAGLLQSVGWLVALVGRESLCTILCWESLTDLILLSSSLPRFSRLDSSRTTNTSMTMFTWRREISARHKQSPETRSRQMFPWLPYHRDEGHRYNKCQYEFVWHGQPATGKEEKKD